MTDKLNLMLPGSPRYQPEQLVPIFGYDYLYKGVADVEIATLEVLGEVGIIPAKDFALFTEELKQALRGITTTQVDKVEREVTKHDIRAGVQIARGILPEPLRRWAHVPLTSYDTLDTGRMLQFHRAYEQALKPSLDEVINQLAAMVKKWSGHVQIGRTHGQHALPVTVGFWMATILQRILYNRQTIDQYVNQLPGKISGAVGAYNAQSGLGIDKQCGSFTFEFLVLEKLGLKSAPISTQILPPEPLAYFLFSNTMLSASLAQFGRDARHLMRSEIAELAEGFEQGQVGSSTMAHKRNPLNFENTEGMYIRTKNELGKVQDTMISEHQRDLTGSSVLRDFPIILVNVLQQINTLLRKNSDGVPFLLRITVDREACQRNLEANGRLILAEPLYIAVQMAGYTGDAHDVVNHKLVEVSRRSGCSLIDALQIAARDDEALAVAFEAIPADVKQLLNDPASYTGRAQEKALEIVALAERRN